MIGKNGFLKKKDSVSKEPKEFFISPDDERSLTILIGVKNKVEKAFLVDKYELSLRGIIRLYTVLKQTRCGWVREMSEELMRIDYRVFCVYDYYCDRLLLINGEFPVEMFTGDILRAKYITDGRDEDDKNRRSIRVFGSIDKRSRFFEMFLNNDGFMNLVDDFESCVIISYSPVQREIILTFLNNIFNTYRLY